MRRPVVIRPFERRDRDQLTALVNLHVAVLPALLAVAADWLLLSGVRRLMTYWAEDVDPIEELAELQRAGFQPLVRNERGFVHHFQREPL